VRYRMQEVVRELGFRVIALRPHRWEYETRAHAEAAYEATVANHTDLAFLAVEQWNEGELGRGCTLVQRAIGSKIELGWWALCCLVCRDPNAEGAVCDGCLTKLDQGARAVQAEVDSLARR
jgi:hypothetical protein